MRLVIAPEDVQNLMKRLGKGASCRYSSEKDSWIVVHPEKAPVIGKVAPEGERMQFKHLFPVAT